MVTNRDPYFSVAEYLQIEERSPIKHEYVDGRLVAMVEVSQAHNTIAMNLIAALRNHLRGTGCRLFASDVKVFIEARNCFYYPDLVVSCDERDHDTPNFLRFPRMIIEVLSDSTEAFDRGDKFNDYQSLESLQEYVLISSKRRSVQCFERTPDNQWLLKSFTPSQQTDIRLECIHFTMPLDAVYEDVFIANA